MNNPTEIVRTVTVSPDGQYIAAGTRNGVLEVWLANHMTYWKIPDAHKG